MWSGSGNGHASSPTPSTKFDQDDASGSNSSFPATKITNSGTVYMFGLIYSATMTTKETSGLTLPCLPIPGFLFKTLAGRCGASVDPERHRMLQSNSARDRESERLRPKQLQLDVTLHARSIENLRPHPPCLAQKWSGHGRGSRTVGAAPASASHVCTSTFASLASSQATLDHCDQTSISQFVSGNMITLYCYIALTVIV